MLTTIFSVLGVILMFVLVWCFCVFCLGASLGFGLFIISTPIFWAALIGGFIAYLCGYTDQGIIYGMLIGGAIASIYYICTIVENYTVLKILFWTSVGVLIGLPLGMMVILGIVGFGFGIYRIA